MANSDLITTNDILEKYKVSFYTVRGWRRGWYTDSRGKHYFYPDQSHLAYEWDEKQQKYFYNPVTVAVWVHRLKEKVSAARAAAGRKSKKTKV